MSKFRLGLLVLFLTTPLFALLEVGDTVPNLCWKDMSGANVCVEDYKDSVRVLNYGAGWCSDCNKEMKDLVPKSKSYEKKPVVFLSLMAAGFKSGTAPEAGFLKEWKEKHSIPFPVLASPKDAGRLFFGAPYAIPNYALIDRNQKLAFKSMSATVDEILVEVDRLL